MIEPQEADEETREVYDGVARQWGRISNLSSEKEIVELTVFCGMWNYSNRLCEALQIDLERPDKRIEFQPK